MSPSAVQLAAKRDATDGPATVSTATIGAHGRCIPWSAPSVAKTPKCRFSPGVTVPSTVAIAIAGRADEAPQAGIRPDKREAENRPPSPSRFFTSNPSVKCRGILSPARGRPSSKVRSHPARSPHPAFKTALTGGSATAFLSLGPGIFVFLTGFLNRALPHFLLPGHPTL